ncbi:MAG: nucleotidyltransferase domain-containing protein [Nakamurella sp.]
MSGLPPGRLQQIAQRLVTVDGIQAVLLGGSRGRGEHTAGSDTDLGLYYRPPLDLDGLRRIARDLGCDEAELTEPGAWGPWVDGGGWLVIDGQPVDWIYRDLDRVQAAWRDAVEGIFTFHAQIGHPLGVPDFSYPGEVALGVVLADPSGELTELRGRTSTYPPALSDAICRKCLWEARFLLSIAAKAVHRADTSYLAGCLFRVVELCAHALHGRAGRWLINEKGAIAAAGRIAFAPSNFAARAHGLLGDLGTTPSQLAKQLREADDLIHQTSRACAPPR